MHYIVPGTEERGAAGTTILSTLLRVGVTGKQGRIFFVVCRAWWGGRKRRFCVIIGHIGMLYRSDCIRIILLGEKI